MGGWVGGCFWGGVDAAHDPDQEAVISLSLSLSLSLCIHPPTHPPTHPPIHPYTPGETTRPLSPRGLKLSGPNGKAWVGGFDGGGGGGGGGGGRRSKAGVRQE